MAKRILPELPELLAEVTEIVDEMEKETDRGAALVGAAFLDDMLSLLLEAALVDEDISKAFLTESGGISEFGIRIKLAYCMGLIGPIMLQDLNLVKEIRDEFAHNLGILDFNTEIISSYCSKLSTYSPTKFFSSNRHEFIFFSAIVTGVIGLRIGNTKRPKSRKDIITTPVLEIKQFDL